MLNKTTALLLLAVLPLSGTWGCASKYGEQTVDPVNFPQCYAPIRQLREDESNVTKSTAVGAVGGAILGAVVGVLATGRVEGAAVGAAAGGIAGAGTGYAVGKSNEAKDQTARMAVYLRDIDGDISGLNAVTASARFSIQCYDKEFRKLIVSYKSAKINRIELDDAYKEIKAGISESERLLGETLQKAYERDAQYQATINNEARQQGTSSPAGKKTRKSDTASGSELGTLQAKKVAYKNTISDGEKARREAQKAQLAHEEELRIITG
ncbi:MAG: hypothetical protein LBN33_07975 [Desulfovibrio sp.]|jgi:outer membrane lipoprotein SlyB|nr:hypothetical protein [Desulfovibrio sp.]